MKSEGTLCDSASSISVGPSLIDPAHVELSRLDLLNTIRISLATSEQTQNGPTCRCALPIPECD
ncbi:hypothetical protein M378DRAFT_170988 [Amanita muscaria Koide BX008]|uniref:Uncharacterized protein n=1 Tax=Amanita muscaria (strain Koide BX008) TaxID=946122 RepID=A0A0C2SVL2_AMAMK|nr:hypothetical protein M378DRAFT_170988 [Amanita muscaria Koide BX008]